VFNSSHTIDIPHITSIIQESENNNLGKENEAMPLKLSHGSVSLNYENLSQNNELCYNLLLAYLIMKYLCV